MEEGLLSLKWNNHKSTFFTVLSLLREKHTYTDVTLACEGRLYPAHRFVLSTCSEYFAEIFSSTTGNNIVIVLKDVRRADLEYLLDYMYLGQVDVAQSELASLIKTAECLRIKGLAIPDDEPPKTLMPRRQGDHREREPSPPSKRKRNQVEDDRTESASNSSNSSNNSSRSGASQHVVGSSSSGGSSQSVMRLPPPSSSLSQSQTSSSPAQSSQAPTLPTKTSLSSSQSSRLAPPQPSGRHTPTSPHPPLTSPTGHSHPGTPAAATAAVIKQEVTEPPDTPEVSYLSESYEETETKPNVGDQDMSMAGPSGLQGGSEGWEGDPELSGFTGDNYSGEGCEDGADSEVQGGPRYVQLDLDVPERCSRSIENSAFSSRPRHMVNSTPTSYSTSHESIVKTWDIREVPETSGTLTGMTSDPQSHGWSHRQERETAGDKYSDPQQGVGHTGNVGLSSTGSGGLACPWCGKMLSKLSNLKVHMRRHTGEKPFHCLFCPYRAAQKVQVLNHVHARHRELSGALTQTHLDRQEQNIGGLL